MNDINNSSNNMFIFIVVLFAVLLFSFIFYGSRIPFVSSYHDRMLKGIKFQQTADIVEIPKLKETEWCKPENIFVDSNVEEPISRKVIGYDDVEKCCVRETFGFNCALLRNATVSVCHTATVGGDIKYVKIDNFEVNISLYKNFIDDLDKKQIENKPCNLEKYPQAIK